MHSQPCRVGGKREKKRKENRISFPPMAPFVKPRFPSGGNRGKRKKKKEGARFWSCIAEKGGGQDGSHLDDSNSSK